MMSLGGAADGTRGNIKRELDRAKREKTHKRKTRMGETGLLCNCGFLLNTLLPCPH